MIDLQAAKAVVRKFYDDLDQAQGDAVIPTLQLHNAPDLVWRGYHPCNIQNGPEAAARAFWLPLKSAFSRMQRRLDLFFSGHNEIDGFQSVWVGTMGHLMGLFDQPLFGIAPTSAPA